MSIFKFEDKEVVRKKSVLLNPKVIFGVALLIAIPAIGNTLASSITVGTANRVEFGQGLTQAVACDSAITVTPQAAFVNEAGGLGASPPPQFNLGSITVAGIAATCNGKYFTLKVYDDTSSTPLNITVPSPSPSGAVQISSVKVQFEKDSTYSVMADPSNTIASIGSQDATSFTVNLQSSIDASTISKITVETSDA